ncbi:MAG: M6 family metalloprotease domain-containing protein, partial [Fidelibacterota bacterium]
RDYYLEVSYGEFDPHSVVSGWYMADMSFVEYGYNAPNGWDNVRQMIAEAVDDAEAQGMDWSQFDNDGDGWVDALNVVHAGPGAEEGNGNFIWSHKWNLGGNARFYDGVWIDSYTINPEIQGSNQNMVYRGVICHEFGHALGLPDLYDTDYTSSGIGNWGLMSGGSWGGNGSSPWYPAHMCAWSKIQLGWITPEIVNEPTITVEMINVEENHLVYRMNGTGVPNEYFLFENRQKILSDQTLVESGLLIWHIDDSMNGNTDDWHHLVDLEQADGNYNLNYGSGSDMGDPYPGSTGNTEFANHTSPNSQFYNGNPSSVSAINIAENDEIITVTFRNLPTLIVDDYQMTEINGDNDGEANPGEFGGLSFTLHNPTPGSVSNLTGEFSTTDPFITLENTAMEFGDIGPFGYSAGLSELVVSIDENAPLGSHFVQVDLLGSSGGDEFTQLLVIDFDIQIYQAGFPIVLENKVISSPLVVDLDNNNTGEIIFGDYSGLLNVVYSDGTPVDGEWPFDTGDQIWGAPAAADIDLDGEIEIIVISKSKHLFILSPNGTVETDYNANQFLIGTPSIGNIDDDDELEIVFVSMASTSHLFAINPDGSDVEGFPLPINEKVYESVALTDFNGNGKADMVFGTDNNHLWLIYDNGETADGFPFTTGGKIRTSPVVFDLESDGQLEILFGCDDQFVYLLTDDGEIIFNYPTGAVVRSSPSILETNSNLILFFGADNGYLFAVDGFGNDLPGWPLLIDQQLRSNSVFADLNDDGNPEIITSGKTGSIFVHQLDGTSYPYFPMSVGFNLECSPIVADTDIDGDLELITGTDHGITAIDIKSSGTVDSWSMFQGNERRTGFVEVNGIQILPGDLNFDNQLDVLDVVSMVSYIMQEQIPGAYEYMAGDLNDDGYLDILDVIILVNLIIPG